MVGMEIELPSMESLVLKFKQEFIRESVGLELNIPVKTMRLLGDEPQSSIK